MALSYHPKEGEVLKCDFGGFTEPEMTKGRYVVVVSPKFIERGRLVTVVPLSLTAPNPVMDYTCEMGTLLPQNEGKEIVVWAKCDMLMAASFTRLSPWWVEKKQGGQRIYKPIVLSDADLKKIKCGVLHSLGMGGLTQHLG
jgi:mRNA interferase MazF